MKRSNDQTSAQDMGNQKVAGVVGLGLDSDEGHKRLTRGQGFLLAGGSEETHARMQETMIKVTERLGQSGRRIEDTTANELRDLMHEASN